MAVSWATSVCTVRVRYSTTPIGSINTNVDVVHPSITKYAWNAINTGPYDIDSDNNFTAQMRVIDSNLSFSEKVDTSNGLTYQTITGQNLRVLTSGADFHALIGLPDALNVIQEVGTPHAGRMRAYIFDRTVRLNGTRYSVYVRG